MKRFFVLLLSASFAANAQNDMFGNSAISSSTGFRDARDISGKSIPNGQNTIEGSPMLADGFVTGTVKLKGNENKYSLLVNFSLVENQLFFQQENQTLKFTDPLENFSLVVKNKDATTIMNFKNGYPSVANNDENTFYQVLYDGSKIQLVKYLYKTVDEKYSYGGPTIKQYVSKYKLYVYDVASKSLNEINPSITSIEKALPNYYTSIEKCVLQNKMKHEQEVVQLVAFLNNEPTKKN